MLLLCSCRAEQQQQPQVQQEPDPLPVLGEAWAQELSGVAGCLERLGLGPASEEAYTRVINRCVCVCGDVVGVEVTQMRVRVCVCVVALAVLLCGVGGVPCPCLTEQGTHKGWLRTGQLRHQQTRSNEATRASRTSNDTGRQCRTGPAYLPAYACLRMPACLHIPACVCLPACVCCRSYVLERLRGLATQEFDAAVLPRAQHLVCAGPLALLRLVLGGAAGAGGGQDLKLQVGFINGGTACGSDPAGMRAGLVVVCRCVMKQASGCSVVVTYGRVLAWTSF